MLLGIRLQGTTSGCGLSNHQAATAQIHLVDKNIAECRPLSGALLLSLDICRTGISDTFLSCTFLVVQPVHLHQHTRAARARKSANMVSANMVSVALNLRRLVVKSSQSAHHLHSMSWPMSERHLHSLLKCNILYYHIIFYYITLHHDMSCHVISYVLCKPILYYTIP